LKKNLRGVVGKKSFQFSFVLFFYILFLRKKINTLLHISMSGGRKRTSRNILLKKGASVAIIILFLVVAVVPSINISVVKAATDNDLVEVTIEVYGIKGFRNHTVKLTEQQYQNLEQYLIDFRERVNSTTTREETVPLFKEAIVEFNKYGLLPKGISVEHAQRLVTGYYQNSNIVRKIQNDVQSIAKIKQNQNLDPNMKNVFCLLYAAATKIPDYSPSSFIIPFGVLLVLGLIPAILASLIGNQELANTLAELGFLIWNSNPFRAFNFVLFMGYELEVRSVGLKGLVHDTLSNGGLFMGFSGLMLSPISDKTYFLGFALNVAGSS
jgi:hypothetical protein